MISLFALEVLPVAVLFFCPLIASVVASSNIDNDGGNYLIGTGIYDITGPAVQVPFMGYAKTAQQGQGIHMRLRSRAFIMAKPQRTTAESEEAFVQQLQQLLPEDDTARYSSRVPDPKQTICFVSADIGMGSDLLTKKVVKRLEELLPGKQPLCRLENLSISGTHTHSAPGGFLQYVLYQINTLGYSDETMEAYMEGIAQSILRAYNNLQKGSIHVAEDKLLESNIDRSPSSYLLNPPEERGMYAAEGDTDKRMLQLRFTAHTDGKDKGILNWFAVHGTSMNYSNHLISGDNKGYASYLMEKHQNGNITLPGQGDFVAAFASTNLGDVSPNTNGAICVDTGLPCDLMTSSCKGRTQMCRSSGPGKNMFESTEIIGRKQFEMALALLTRDEEKKLKGGISFRHSFVDMANCTVHLPDGQAVRTCPAALGYGFGGGTTDGPGFDFTQGRNTSNPFWNMISNFLSKPSKEQVHCHHPKPILLNIGEATDPYRWNPKPVPVSIFKVGSLFILNIPAELTTMAGRRLRKATMETAFAMGIKEPIVTVAGLSNSYTHYIATFEEYAGQRYEAASTLYGPHTLAAYIQEFTRITRDLISNATSRTSDSPVDLSDDQISLVPPVLVDPIEIGKKFGSVVHGPKNEYKVGKDIALVTFRSANPRNNLRIEGTFLTIERLLHDESWQTTYVDGDWCTRVSWKADPFWGFIFAEISWQMPIETHVGTYRICHFGAAKQLLQTEHDKLRRGRGGRIESSVGDHIKEFTGCTKSFLVK